MAHLKLPVMIFLFAFILIACSCKNSPNNGKEKNAAQVPADDPMPGASSNNSGSSSSNNNGSFSYTIEGRQVDVKGLYLNEVKNNPAGGRVKIEVTNTATSEVFNFSIANAGATTILHYSPSLSNFADKKSSKAEYMSHKFKNYYGDSVVVNITDINSTHVAGTFAGKFLSEDATPVALEITAGSFDVPFTKNEDN